jgi:hypothetical protein
MQYIGLKQNLRYYLGLSNIKKYGDVSQNTINNVLEAIDFVFRKDNFKGSMPKIHIATGAIILSDGHKQRASYDYKKRIIQISESEIREYAHNNGMCANLELTICAAHEAKHHVQNIQNCKMNEIASNTVDEMDKIKKHPLEIEAWDYGLAAVKHKYSISVKRSFLGDTVNLHVYLLPPYLVQLLHPFFPKH